MVLPTNEQSPAPAPLELAGRRVPSLALHPGETLASGVPRIATAQLDWMLYQLRREPNRDLAVHQTRKAAKRVRTTLRLVRGELGQFRFREENVVLRDAARRLSPVRSSAVMVETVDEMTATDRDPLPAASRLQLRSMLETRHSRLAAAVIGHPQLTTDVVVTLLTARSRYRAWPVDQTSRHPRYPDVRAFRDTYDAIAPGICLTYERGRRAMQLATSDRSITCLHMWRKRVKYLGYQMRILENVRAEVMQPLADDLDELGGLLGYEHDCAELGELIAMEPSYVPNPIERFRYLSAIVANRMELQAQALRLGARLYDEAPAAFVARLGVHWNASRP
jgi:CHAD domain-containing protein